MPASHLAHLVAGVRQALDPAGRPDRDLLDRFIATGDPAAFEALVRRHGPQVLAVCQRVLPGPDADDAFQAAFLALARDARRVRGAVGGWLVVVAHRVAVRLRAAERRRQKVEARHAGPTADDRDPSWREACAVLHAELDRLPARYRRPLILCYLRGLTRDEAAHELGCTVGVLKGNLERGRTRLRTLLARRGLTLSAGLLGATAGVSAAVPPRLTRAVLDRRPSPAAAEVVRALRPTGTAWKAASALGLAAGLLVAITAGDPTKPAAAGQSTPPIAKADEKKPIFPLQVEPVAVKGRVLGPDGKPVAGAKLTVLDGAGGRPAPQASTDADGSFAFTLDAPQISFHLRYVLARAPGLGCDWVEVPARQPAGEFTLRLPGDVPIAGRVIDLEGKAVAGAKVRVQMIEGPEPGRFDEFLKAWAGTPLEHEQSVYMLPKRLYENPGIDDLFAATTDAAGRFTLAGIGTDRVPALIVAAPGQAVEPVRVATRAGFKNVGRKKYRMQGPDCVVTLGPTKPVAGVVRDAKTKKPIASVRVVAHAEDESAFLRRRIESETTTDADGKYTLTGLPKVKRQVVLVDPKPGTGHLFHYAELFDTAGFAPIRHDVELTPGVVLTGRVTDTETGRPVRARVWYRPLDDNAFEEKVPGYEYVNFGPWAHADDGLTDADGAYRLTVLPGTGLLHVQAWDGTSPKLYPEARLDPADEKRGAYWRPFKDSPEFVQFKTGGRGGGYGPQQLNAYRVIELKPTDATATADFALWPGVSRKLKLVDPDGRPLTGVDCHGLAPMGDDVAATGPEVTAIALDPTRARRLLFRHAERKLTAIVSIRGDEPEPVMVKLVPRSAITGRVVDAAGKPVAGATVEPSYEDHPTGTLLNTERINNPQAAVKTDAEGRFRFDGVPAGIKLRLIARRVKDDYWYSKGMIVLEPGQVKDLGDWKRE